MGLISRVSSRTYSKTGNPGDECLVYKTSAKARELSTPSKSPTSLSYNCNYFQTKKYHSSTNTSVRYKTQSLRKHHSLSKITFSYELESKAKTTSSYNYSTFPCQILLNLPNTSTKTITKIPPKIMSAAKVRVHTTSTSSIDAVFEPIRNFEKISIDSAKLQVTCKEDFLADVKVL